MTYTEEEIEEKFDLIIKDISENGMPIRQALKGMNMPSSSTFFKWIAENEDMAKRYARACEVRADMIFEEILEISDKQSEDVIGEDEYGNQIINHNIIQRNRLQVDARKWVLGKMNPKKYGDKVDVTTGGEKINTPPVIQVEIMKNED